MFIIKKEYLDKIAFSHGEDAIDGLENICRQLIEFGIPIKVEYDDYQSEISNEEKLKEFVAFLWGIYSS